jgi:hypothetical protein
VQVDPMKPILTAPRTKHLKLEHVTLLSSFAFNFNLRRHHEDEALYPPDAAADIALVGWGLTVCP